MGGLSTLSHTVGSLVSTESIKRFLVLAIFAPKMG